MLGRKIRRKTGVGERERERVRERDRAMAEDTVFTSSSTNTI